MIYLGVLQVPSSIKGLDFDHFSSCLGYSWNSVIKICSGIKWKRQGKQTWLITSGCSSKSCRRQGIWCPWLHPHQQGEGGAGPLFGEQMLTQHFAQGHVLSLPPGHAAKGSKLWAQWTMFPSMEGINYRLSLFLCRW